MKTNCINCQNPNPKHDMKTCCRKCADEYKTKINSWTRDCLYCKTSFTTRKSNKKSLCSEECRKLWAALPENIESRIKKCNEAIKEKFGVANVFQLEEVKNKSKKKKLEKYGDENYNNGSKAVITKRELYGDDYYTNMLEAQKVKTFIKKYGVDHPLKLDEFKDKQKATVQEKYGVDNVSQNEEVKSKRTDTILERYGVENASQSEEIKQKKKDTSMENFGVDHHLKDYNRLQKHLMISYKVHKYKETELTYQGSYEYYFLECLEKRGLLNQVANGGSFEYEFLGQKHMYHTDFFFIGQHIEIKSGWTYDGNGTNLSLKELNHTKWDAVTAAGASIRVLKSKKEILEYINYL
jgi:hypothetical protein